MKLFATISVLFSINCFAAENLGVYFDQIKYSYDYDSSAIWDFSQLDKKVMTGRCFSPVHSKPSGSAIAFQNLAYDNGPIGTPGEYITYSSFGVETDPQYFDMYTFEQYNYWLRSQTYAHYEETKLENNSNKAGSYWSFRKANSKDYIYAVKTDDFNQVQLACYYYRISE